MYRSIVFNSKSCHYQILW